MTKIEAKSKVTEYRALLQAWTIAISGLSHGDTDAIGMKLRQGEGDLAAIAI